MREALSPYVEQVVDKSLSSGHEMLGSDAGQSFSSPTVGKESGRISPTHYPRE